MADGDDDTDLWVKVLVLLLPNQLSSVLVLSTSSADTGQNSLFKSLSLHHEGGDQVRQPHSLHETVHPFLGTVTAGSKWRDETDQEAREESNPPYHQHQGEEPDNSKAETLDFAHWMVSS